MTIERQPSAIVRLCETCQPDATERQVEMLRDALREASLADKVEVHRQACFNVCQNPLAMAIQGPGRATYVFGDLKLPNDTADLIATLELYLQSPAGWIEDARGCGRLRHCLRARVMALPEDTSQR